MRESKDMPSDGPPNLDIDELMKKLGFMHITEALQCEGEILLLRDQLSMELKKDLMANVGKIMNKTEEEVEAIIMSIIQKHINRFDDRTKAIMRDYFPKK